jgi:hypothetical protein
MSRWKAAGIHLSISITIGVAAALLIFGLWYPPPYASATGAPELVMLLLGVDLTLGPLLTLVVFKAGKKSLPFDLSVIAVLQAAALVYGISVVARARPVYIVGAVDRFVVVTANELEPEDLAEAKPAFRKLPWAGPKVIGVERPATSQERMDLTFSALAGKDAEKFPKYYVPYPEAAPGLLTRARPLASLRRTHPRTGPVVDDWVAASGRDPETIVVLPVVSRRADLAMLLDATTGEPLDALPLGIW